MTNTAMYGQYMRVFSARDSTKHDQTVRIDQPPRLTSLTSRSANLNRITPIEVIPISILGKHTEIVMIVGLEVGKDKCTIS